MASSALTMDDMAGFGLGEINMDEITGHRRGRRRGRGPVAREGQEIDLSDLAKSTESAPIIKVSNLILIEAFKAARRTSTSSRTRRSSASGSGWTACSTTSWRCRCARGTR